MNKIYATNWHQAVERPSNFMGNTRLFARNRLLDILSLADIHPPQPEFLRCLFCHYVFDDQIAEFEKIIIGLKQIGKFVDTDTLLNMLSGNKPIAGRYFHLSFDDGLKNNFSNAMPILKKHQIPALFFVPSALIDADWETAEHYCLTTTRYNNVIEMASWFDLKSAVDNGFEIGSHGKSHTRLSAISDNPIRLYEEVAESKLQLENKLGVECKYIAWPYGTIKDIDQAGFSAIKAAGYKAAFANFRAAVRPGVTDPFCIPRHHFEPQWPWRHIQYFANGRKEAS